MRWTLAVKVSGHVLPTGDRSSSYAQEGVGKEVVRLPVAANRQIR